MTEAASILSADMTTIGRWLASGLRWWVDELAGLVPIDLGAATGRAQRLLFDGSTGLTRLHHDGSSDAVMPSVTPRAANVDFARSSALVRTMEMPAMTARDLRAMVALDADRLMPSPGGRMLVAARAVGTTATGQQQIEIAGVALSEAQRLAETCTALNVAPRRIGLHDPAGIALPAFDFAPAMRAAGVLPGEGGSRLFWWAVVAFLVFANVVALVARDQAATDAIAQTVDEQQPAVAIADRIKHKLTNDQKRVEDTLARRNSANGMMAMAIVAEALPRGAWVQRFDWRDGRIQLSGYKIKGVDVIAALRQSPRLTEVRQASGAVSADIPIGQPFELTARIGAN